MRDLPHINTDLRPDYYEFFPRFSEGELAARLARMPWQLATLLDPWNIRLARQYQLSDCSGPVGAADLSTVLKAIGLSSEVVAAVESIDRSAFLMPSITSDPYLNMSLQLHSTSTWVSAPGVVALMLEQIAGHVGDNTLEIGVGTGYHAAVFLQMHTQCRFTGVDPNSMALELAERNLRDLGFGERVTLVQGPALSLEQAAWDTIYATTALDSVDIYAALELSTLNDLHFQCPRPISRAEFETESPRSWLRNNFNTYDSYRTGDWRDYLALTVFRCRNSSIDPIGESIYDLSFVPYINSGRLGSATR